jgi:hypothetical protein
MDIILDKVAYLNSIGWLIDPDELLMVPLLDGGRSAIVPSSSAAIFEPPTLPKAFFLHSDILLEYTAQGGPAGALGYPIDDQNQWGNGKTQGVLCQFGQILFHPESGCRTYFGSLVANLLNCASIAEAMLQVDPDAAYAAIRSKENIDTSVNWCGFALYNIMRSGGLDNSHRGYFPNTQGLLNFGSYYSRTIYGVETRRQKVTTVKETGQDIIDFHSENGSARTITLWETLQDESASLDIVPGDIVLLDHERGGGPDHIQIAHSWHPDLRMLSVIDGNGGGFVLRSTLEAKFGTSDLVEGIHFRTAKTIADPGKAVAEATKQELLFQNCGLDVLLPKDFSGRVSVSCHLLRADSQINPTSQTATNPHSRVFAIIRPAETDFQSHNYANI